MNWHKLWQFVLSDYLKLIVILVLAFYVAFIPHQHYPYAIHVDEWVHLAQSEAMLQTGSITYADPFFGEPVISLSSNLEAGFHLFWGVFQSISGIDWMEIFRYFPGIIFMITVLAVFVLARREGFGWEAAFFTCLIPTTVGVLGPAFLVPVAMGLLFTPVILFLAFNFKTIWSYLLIFIFICFLLAIHAPSAICPIIVLIPYILINLKGNIKHSLGIGLALIIPFLGVIPWIFSLLLPTARDIISTPITPTAFVELPSLIQVYGYLPTASCLLGILLLVTKGGKKNYSLTLGLLAILLMLVTFFTLHRGVPIMYERGIMYMLLVMCVVAGAGLMGIRKLQLPEKVSNWLRVPLITQNVGKVLCLIFIVITLIVSIPARQDTLYYNMIDSDDYQAFIWVRENVGGNYEKALLDPWKATAFTGITGRYIYSRIHAYPKATDEEAYAFIRNGSSNTTFLKEHGISIIYTRVYNGPREGNKEYKSNNPDLEEVARNIYLLK